MDIRSLVISSLVATTPTLACSKAPEAPAVATTPAPAPTTTPTAAPAAPAIEDVAPAAEVAPSEPAAIDEDATEKDPSATDKVVPKLLESDAIEEAGLPGQIQAYLGWTDRHGTNALVLTREVPKGAGAELVATHLNREGDGSWTKVRDFRELVSDCKDWRLTLKAQIVEDSLTDLDNDGLGEATFAWSAGCRTDWSPVTHKVLLVESGEKYVLRGKTNATTFDADAAFDKAPATFRQHAEKVWAATAMERPPERASYEHEAQWGSVFLDWERLGQLPIGTNQAVVEAHYGKPESKDAIFHDADASGQYFETWNYPTRGLVITFIGEDSKLADGGIASLTVTTPSDFKTRQGIGVGSSEAELERLYGRFRNTDASRPGWLGIGIEWTWLTFELKDGKVASIRSGLGEQPPSPDE